MALDDQAKEDSNGPPRVRARQGELHIRWSIGLALSVAGGIWGLGFQLRDVGDKATAAAIGQCSIQNDQLRREFEQALQREIERAQETEREIKNDIRELRTPVLTRSRR